MPVDFDTLTESQLLWQTVSYLERVHADARMIAPVKHAARLFARIEQERGTVPVVEKVAGAVTQGSGV